MPDDLDPHAMPDQTRSNASLRLPIRWPDHIRFRSQDRVQAVLSRLITFDPRELGRIFTLLDVETLMGDCHTADHRARGKGRDKLPLYGTTITIKDLFDVQGQVTAAGSAILATANAASSDCPAVARLRLAGAVPFGRTNMTEFAYSGVGQNPHFGTPSNARVPGAIPGGSTSGGAVAVAHGWCDAALGSDTSGSGRIPAAFNRIVGFKPSQNTIPLEGAFPLSPTYDTVAVMANTVATVRQISAVLMEKDLPPKRVTPAELRLAVLDTLAMDDLDPAVAADFERVLAGLAKAGVTIDRVSVPELAEAPTVNRVIVATDAYRVHQARMERHAKAYDPLVLERIRFADDVSAAEGTGARMKRMAAIKAFAEATAAFDAVICPTVAVPPMPIETALANFQTLNPLILRNTGLVNMADGCSISVPMSAPNAPPTGFMISAAKGKDRQVLDIAQSLDRIIRGA